MPKASDATGSYSPVFQSLEERKIDLDLIQKAEKELEEYRGHLREAQSCLTDPTLSFEEQQDIMKLIEQFTPRLREKEDRLNAHKARLGLLEVNQPIRIQP